MIVLAIGVLLAAAGSAQAALISYWNFNEGSGTVANDFNTVNANNGTLQGSGGLLPLWVAGHTGLAGDYALQFNDSTWNRKVWVKVLDSASLHIGNVDHKPFTVASWVFDMEGYYAYIFDCNGRKWFLQGGADTGGDAYFYSDPKGAFNTNFNAGYGTWKWAHLAVTYDGTTVRTYIDGVAKGTKACTDAFATWGDLYLGDKSGGPARWDVWGGYLDDMVIFDECVAPADIGKVMGGTYDGMPEPATLVLLGLGVGGMLLRRRRR
jgi:hypothetical protein